MSYVFYRDRARACAKYMWHPPFARANTHTHTQVHKIISATTGRIISVEIDPSLPTVPRLGHNLGLCSGPYNQRTLNFEHIRAQGRSSIVKPRPQPECHTSMLSCGSAMLSSRCVLTAAAYGRVATRGQLISVREFGPRQSEQEKTSEPAATTTSRVFRLNTRTQEKEVRRDMCAGWWSNWAYCKWSVIIFDLRSWVCVTACHFMKHTRRLNDHFQRYHHYYFCQPISSEYWFRFCICSKGALITFTVYYFQYKNSWG